MQRCMLAIFAVLLAVGRVSALVVTFDNEHHGRETFAGGDGTWMQIAAVLNSPGREYWRDRGSNGFGNDHHSIVAAYCGDAAALNKLLRTLAELPAETQAEVVLVPGTGMIVDKEGRKIACDWRVRLVYDHAYHPTLRAQSKPAATLTVRIEVFLPDLPEPAPTAKPEQIAAWISDLKDKQFTVREKAQNELTRQGPAIRPTLEQALAGELTAEQKRRLERVLAFFRRLRLGDIDKPRGLRFVSFDMLVERERKLLLKNEPALRWQASQRLHDVVEGNPELLPLVTSQLDDEMFGALQRQVRDAPKDCLLDFTLLIDVKSVNASAQAKYASAYRDLRRRLDQFCR